MPGTGLRSRIGGRLRAIPSWQITLGLALLGLGFLIAAQLATERPRVRYTTQERAPLIETALDLQDQQEALSAQVLELRARIQDLEQQGQGTSAAIGELNDQLEEARLASGLIPLRGTGVVFQLEDSAEPPAAGENELDYLVSARDLRTMVEELWLAGAEAVAINGERVVPTTAIIDIGGVVLANSAYLAPPYQVAAIGSENLYEDVVGSPGFADFVRARQDGYGIRIGYLEPEAVDIPAFAGTVTLRHARPAPSGAARERSAGVRVGGLGSAMRRLRNQVTIAAVSFILGLLVVVQLRAQAAGSGLGAMSSQDLTVFVANLNAGLDQRRQEIAALERDLATLSANADRGVVSLGQVRDELGSIRAYAGLDPVVGPGVTVTVDGPIDGPAVEDLVNELRNAGAEAIAIDGVRLVAGSVVTGGPGEVAVEGDRLDDPFTVSAIGGAETLTGSLTRIGGIVAQVAATYPDVTLTVTPVTRLELPATTRVLVPKHGGPRL